MTKTLPLRDIENVELCETSDKSALALYSITQATRARFTELYINRSTLIFIQRGSKFVQSQERKGILGEEGDLVVFPRGTLITMENRPRIDKDYHAIGVSFTQDLVDEVFAGQSSTQAAKTLSVLRAKPHHPERILSLIQATLQDHSLPQEIRAHRLREPLIWLRAQGISLPIHIEDGLTGQLRALFQRDLTHPWRAEDTAKHFAMSPATFRRWLAKSGTSFSKLLMNTRLEHALLCLQTRDTQISQIALECGFKTPSHFSDAFRKRFSIRPIDIRSAAN